MSDPFFSVLNLKDAFLSMYLSSSLGILSPIGFDMLSNDLSIDMFVMLNIIRGRVNNLSKILVLIRKPLKAKIFLLIPFPYQNQNFLYKMALFVRFGRIFPIRKVLSTMLILKAVKTR